MQWASQAWWHAALIPTARVAEQEDHKWKAKPGQQTEAQEIEHKELGF